MITIRAEFKTRTEMGLTDCTTEKIIFGDYRDIEHVEEAVAWIKKLFNSKKYSNQLVDFCHFDGNVERTVSRYFRFYSDDVNKVYFGGMGNGIKEDNVKFTAREIKKAYLQCADKANEWEEALAEKEVK